ncbi:TetR family transcriptional regulator [Auraticoccus sp. F435]|uniref:TetR family transcriptional regulator n=1 Tax=Auraticoccus cholistanensis TaxID=2656650 RepID=A0A6A9UU01_9ACTN|nr:TetR/AcrR family transcriptional regulator [Auraticoccus cholistanensis]MVA76148.1 TetR family transcriptional regulator [Auraticoccus cholistanensis]
MLRVDTARAQRLPRDQRRAQLLAAATRAFSDRGYHAVAMDDVAEGAGVSKPVLYQHFASKLELYLALLDSACQELVDMVAGALASTTRNSDRVAAAMAAFFGFVAARGSSFRFVFESDLRTEPEVALRIRAVHQELAAQIGAVIAADTGLEQPEAELLGFSLIGMAETGARYWLDEPAGVARERAVELASTLAWRGVRGFPRASAE